MCAQGALGRYLVWRFHPLGRRNIIPDPIDKEDWLSVVLFPESKTDSSARQVLPPPAPPCALLT